MDKIEHFKKTRRAWQKMHGMKGGKRLRIVDIAPDGTRIRAVASATRMTYAHDGPSKARRPSTRRTALWAVS